MDIRKHIKELLFLHDCVIIPGFGGFVTNYQAAEIQRFKNVIYPPSKSLMFNRRLVTNDGVLVNHIAQREKLDYKTAEEKIRQSADIWNRLIDNKGMLLFPDIGKLYINSANALVFLPELRKNYLTDTFGLKPIAYHPNTDSKPAKIIEMKRTSEPAEETETGEEQPAKSNTGKWVAAIAAIFVLLLLIPQLFMQNMLPENLRIQQLNVMHFFSADSSENKDTEVKFKPLSGESESNAYSDTNLTSETSDTTSATPVAEESSEEQYPEAIPAEENTEPAKSSIALPSSGNFYIVFGESDFISDAVKLKKQLDSEHGKTFEIFSAESGNYAVGLRAGESKEQAEASLGYFRSSNSDLKVVVRE